MAHEWSSSTSQEVSQPPCTPPHAAAPKTKEGHPQHIAHLSARKRDAHLILPFVRERKNLDPALKIGGNVKPEVLFHILRKYIEPAMRSAMCTYQHAKDGEMRARPVLSHLFPVIWQLVPRGEMLKKYMQAKDDTTGLEVFSLTHIGEREEEKRSKVPRLEEIPQDSVFSLYTRYEDRSVLHEREALDFSFSGKSATTLENVWKLLVYAKDDELGKKGRWSDIIVWQLLSYGALYGLENAKKGRMNILHLAGMQLGVFAMAQLHIYGAIEVRDGRITKEAFETYKLQEKFYVLTVEQRPSYFLIEKRNEKDLQEDLNMARREVENRVGDAKFLDGWYIVGDVYIDDEPVQWDDFASNPPSKIAESMFVVEYLLEVLVGRKTRSWTVTDVDDIYKDNKEKYSREPDYEAIKSLALNHFQTWMHTRNMSPPCQRNMSLPPQCRLGRRQR